MCHFVACATLYHVQSILCTILCYIPLQEHHTILMQERNKREGHRIKDGGIPQPNTQISISDISIFSSRCRFPYVLGKCTHINQPYLLNTTSYHFKYFNTAQSPYFTAITLFYPDPDYPYYHQFYLNNSILPHFVLMCSLF